MADIEARLTPEAARTKYEPHIKTGRFTKSLLFELCDDLVRPNGRVFSDVLNQMEKLMLKESELKSKEVIVTL